MIYKVSARIFKDNWLWGIGHGQFKVRYNEYQAAYLGSSDINSKEAMLADNSFYAFNDFFQVLIENGIIGFSFWALAIFLLIRQIKIAYASPDNKHVFVASIASLICIWTASFFSYPLRILPIIIQTDICLALVNSCQQNRILLSVFKTKAFKIALMLTSVLVLIHFYFLVQYKVKAHHAFELYRAGLKKKALEKYKSLSKSYIYDGNTMYLYAKELYYMGHLAQATEILQKVKQHYCTSEVYNVSKNRS